MPSRVRAILYNEDREIVVNDIKNSIKNLVAFGATDIFLACNTSHYFLDGILESENFICNIHNIIEECNRNLEKQNIKRAYLLASEGTIQTKIFEQKNKNINLISSSEDFEKTRIFIESVKQNKVSLLRRK